MNEMTDSQKAFTSLLKDVISSPVVTEFEAVSGDATVDVGDIINNKVDMADVKEFDKAPGGSTSSGAFGHEVKEQHDKAAAGGIKGAYPPKPVADAAHNAGIDAENNINGNRRGFNLNENFFLENNGNVTSQIISKGPNGVINITKTNLGKPPSNFVERK